MSPTGTPRHNWRKTTPTKRPGYRAATSNPKPEDVRRAEYLESVKSAQKPSWERTSLQEHLAEFHKATGIKVVDLVDNSVTYWHKQRSDEPTLQPSVEDAPPPRQP